MAGTRISLFGAPRIERDGEPITINRRKSLALLAYLLLTGQPHARDHLATLLWPEYDASSARANLRRTLSGLRSDLGEEALQIDSEQVAIAPGFQPWVDVCVFQETLARHDNHSQPCPTCQQELAAAAELYSADFLAGFTLPDCPAFDDWQFFQSDSLRRSLATTLQRLIAWLAAAGDYAPAIDYARRWLALDPLHEPAHRQLMLLFAWAGQQAAALRQFDECTRILKDELDLDPEPETLQLFEAIRARQIQPPSHPAAPVLAPAVESLPPSQTALPPLRLPAEVTPLVGRERELDQLGELLAQPETRLITIVGLGGVGKTRLAAALARRQAEADPPRFPDGIVFISLAAIEDPASMPYTLASSLDLSLSGQIEPLQEVCNVLGKRKALLFLDNFEQLLSAATVVTRLLAACPNLKLVVTSREPLRLTVEWQFQLDGLPCPGDSCAGAAEFASVQLFTQVARRVSLNFELSAESELHVCRLCRLTAGMPLAIQMAAAWLHIMPPDQIVTEVERNLDLLATQARDLPDRQRSVRAVFDSTWEQLGPAEQQAFARLSIFRGGFDGQATRQVAGVSPVFLAGLVERGLVQRTETNRYQLHALMRQFGAEKLAEAGGKKSIAQQHSLYYLALLGALDPALHGPAPAEAMTAVRREIDNIRQAWQNALSLGLFEELGLALRPALAFGEFSGNFSETERALREAATVLDGLPEPENHPLLLCQVLVGMLHFVLLQGKDVGAEAWMEKATVLARQLQDPECLAGLDFIQANRLHTMANFEAAEERFREAVTRYRAINLPWRLCTALNYLGEVLSSTGQPDQARAFHEEALQVATQNQDVRMQALSRSHMGVSYYYKGEYARALEFWEQALATFQKLTDPLGLGRTLNNIAYVQNLLGNPDQALERVRQAIPLLRQIGDERNEANAVDTMGDAYFSLGDYPAARRCYQQALAYARRNEMILWDQISFLTNLGILETAQGNYEEAERYLQSALDLVPEHENPAEYRRVNAALGDLYNRSGRREEALRVVETALELAESADLITYPRLELQYLKAAILYENGDLERAWEEVCRAEVMAGQLTNPKPAFEIRLLQANLMARRGAAEQAKKLVQELLGVDRNPAETAAAHYTLWQITGDKQAARRAQTLYTRLLTNTPDARYAARLRELSAAPTA